MRVREHHGYGHGLRPGTIEDINCASCKYEKAWGITPIITDGPPPGSAQLRQRAAEELAAEFGNDVSEWTV